MASIKKSPADKDLVIKNFLAATKKERPYLEAWVKASKRTGESIEEFLRRQLIFVSVQFAAANEGNSRNIQHKASMEALEEERKEVDFEFSS